METNNNHKANIPDSSNAGNTLPTNIVLAEDDSDDRYLFEEALTKANPDAELTTVENGEELMKHLHDKGEPNPDMIFMDINMPVKNGIETLEEIRDKEQFNDIPVVMLSTSDNKKDIEETYAKGANLYVKKPSLFSHFIKILKKIFALDWKAFLSKPKKENFVIKPEED
jgi:CheY-like chemotaxis protein